MWGRQTASMKLIKRHKPLKRIDAKSIKRAQSNTRVVL